MTDRAVWPPSSVRPGDSLDVVGIGEAMLLLQAPPPISLEDATSLTVAVAGAELTVCATVARLGGRSAFLSAVGADAPGRRVSRAVRELGVTDDLLVVDPTRPTGIFLRETPPSGERRVAYYRTGSAASALDASAARLLATPSAPRAVVLSGLTASLGDGPRQLLDAVSSQARAAGTAVVLDPNFRPSLGTSDALALTRQVLPRVDLLVLGTDESGPLFGETEPERVFAAAKQSGVRETVLKGGEHGCWVWDDGVQHVPSMAATVVDTVGAGDAFLGGYLTGRLAGARPTVAARLASHLAAKVVETPGDVEGLPSSDEARQLLAQELTQGRT